MRGSCFCNAQEHRDEALVDCHGKGHLLHVAWGVRRGILDACVREAEAWDAAQFGNNLWFLAHGLALCEWLEPSRRVRSGYCRGVACFSARMGEADVKEEVMRQRRRPSLCDSVMLQWNSRSGGARGPAYRKTHPRKGGRARGTGGRWRETVCSQNLTR